MAKKKPAAPQKLTGREVINRKTDSIETRFYVPRGGGKGGVRKATPDEVKAALRAAPQDFDANKLDAQARQYLGRIKGGKKRQQSATRIEGKFVSPNFIKENGFDEIAKQKGYSTPEELWLNEPAIYKAAKAMYETDAGLIKADIDGKELIQLVDTFKHRIFINDVEVTKLDAIRAVDDFEKWAKRVLGAFFNLHDIAYKRGNEMHLTLPTAEEMEDYEAALEDFGDDDESGEKEDETREIINALLKKYKIQIRTSPEKASKKIDDEKKPPRYWYEYVYRERKKNKQVGRRKKGTLQAYDLAQAIDMVYSMHGDNENIAIISINRIYGTTGGTSKK